MIERERERRLLSKMARVHTNGRARFEIYACKAAVSTSCRSLYFHVIVLLDVIQPEKHGEIFAIGRWNVELDLVAYENNSLRRPVVWQFDICIARRIQLEVMYQFVLQVFCMCLLQLFREALHFFVYFELRITLGRSPSTPFGWWRSSGRGRWRSSFLFHPE